jgi:hypothetical protein
MVIIPSKAQTFNRRCWQTRGAKAGMARAGVGLDFNTSRVQVKKHREPKIPCAMVEKRDRQIKKARSRNES